MKVHSSALNYPDLSMMTGVYQTRPVPPFGIGCEAAGEVIFVGPDASYDAGRGFFPAPRVGDRVFVNSRLNCHGSRIAVRGACCTPMPADFDFDDAAGYILTLSSAYAALVSRMNLQPDEWLVITGSTGTIGLGGVQIAKKIGAKVIALGSDLKGTGRLDVVKRMGADHVIDYTKNPNWSAQVKELTGGRGCQCAYDVVGGDMFMQCVRACANGGRICVGGFVAGFPQLPMNLTLVKGLTVSALSTAWPRNPEAEAARRRRFLDWAKDSAMKPHISHRLPLSEIKEALRVMRDREMVGRIVVHPQEF